MTDEALWRIVEVGDEDFVAELGGGRERFMNDEVALVDQERIKVGSLFRWVVRPGSARLDFRDP